MKEHRDGQGQLKRPEFMRNKVRATSGNGHVKMLSETDGIINGLGIGKTLDSNYKNMGFGFSPLLVKEIKTERTTKPV